MRDWRVRDWGINDDGVYFNAVHYFCTEVNRDEGILRCICMQHIHIHSREHTLNEALLRRQNGSRVNPVLLDLVHCFTQSLCSLLGSLGVALHTQDFTIQWVTAVFICFYGEGTSTVLTTVTLEMEVLVKSHNSDCLLAAWGWNDGLIAAHTQRGEAPVIILDTVGVVVVIGDEGRTLKYAGAGAAAETVGVETLAHCLQHTVCDPLSTPGTHCQGTHVAVLTLRSAIPVIELHALQGAVTTHATEAVGVEEFIHGSHCGLSAG